MPRLFAAIEIPEPIRDELSDLEAPLPGARWVETDNMHLTLRFAGDIDKSLAQELMHALDRVEVNAFAMRLSGLDTFGGREPKSIWAGVEAPDELDRLAYAVERAARDAGLPPETRKFKPHVTIARLKHSDPQAIARFLQRRGAYRSAYFPVGRFVLYSSKPLVGGGPYVAEEYFPLEGGDYAHYADEDERAL